MSTYVLLLVLRVVLPASLWSICASETLNLYLVLVLRLLHKTGVTLKKKCTVNSRSGARNMDGEETANINCGLVLNESTNCIYGWAGLLVWLG